MKITVFGGSLPQPGSPAYQDAYNLGNKLASARHTVLTGGYIGTMEAVSKGASEAGGHIIGVTCQEIENWRAVKANQWVKEEIRCDTLLDRLDRLVRDCDVAMALPGGPGTLTEIGLTWNLMIIHAMPTKPLILIGSEWHGVFEKLFASLGEYVPVAQQGLIFFAGNVETACDLVMNGK